MPGGDEEFESGEYDNVSNKEDEIEDFSPGSEFENTFIHSFSIFFLIFCNVLMNLWNWESHDSPFSEVHFICYIITVCNKVTKSFSF